MQLSIIALADFIFDDYQNTNIEEADFTHFQYCTRIFFEKLEDANNKNESEEHFKTILRDFLNESFYQNRNAINTGGRTDLVIHTRNTTQSEVAVLMEVKRPANKTDMISAIQPNQKALHELILYFLRERFEKNNVQIRHLLISNMIDFFIFDAIEFEKLFFRNKEISQLFKDWSAKQTVSTSTDTFYEAIKNILAASGIDLPCTHFKIQDYQNKPTEQNLALLFKLFSPRQLLKERQMGDSNELNKEFYFELLHILGLEEVNEKGLLLIKRKKPTALKDWEILIYRGVVTGFNNAFVIDTATKNALIARDTKSEELLKPFLRGRDIKKWQPEYADLWLIFSRRGTDIEQYPAIKAYLHQFHEDLKPKKDKNDTQGRKPGTYQWFEIQDNVTYFSEFEKAKIIYPNMTAFLPFVYDEKLLL